jgi:hypothetical protein
VKLKGHHLASVAEIQAAVTDDLQKVQKRGFFWQLFRNFMTVQKAVCMPKELIFNKRSYVSYVSSVFKKISPLYLSHTSQISILPQQQLYIQGQNFV